MALPASGLIKLSDIAAELGDPLTSFRLTQSDSRTLAGVSSGQINLSHFYGKTSIIARTIAANTTDLNLFALAGSPTLKGHFQFTINAGVVVGQVSAAVALDVGQFPSGSVIDIIINGSVQGKGGVGNSGSGGDAFKANYPNQTVNLNVASGGSIYAGGGGGGHGGDGGTGGTGGGGYYTYAQPSGGGVSQVNGSCNGACSSTYGGAYACYSGCSSSSVCTAVDDKGNCTIYGTQYTCATCYYTATAYTSGGGGGAGGAGGNGGRGQGCDGVNVGGYNGAVGSSGAGGGTNAGAGGTGGTGGSGGAGGGWGAGGSPGGSGQNGYTGASGNYTAGSGGSAGGAGYSPGPAGRAILKGTAVLNITNNGGIAGATV